jgi:hypothetical protein
MLTSDRPADRHSTRMRRASRRRLAQVTAASCLCLALLAWMLSLASQATARLGWSLTLTASPASGATGTQATLTAVANMPLAHRAYINIWRVGVRGVLKTCAVGERCTVVVTPPGDANPSPAPTTTSTTYRAQISRVRHHRIPASRAFATAKATVTRTGPRCAPSSCPTM